jgi:hypothetical protein
MKALRVWQRICHYLIVIHTKAAELMAAGTIALAVFIRLFRAAGGHINFLLEDFLDLQLLLSAFFS